MRELQEILNDDKLNDVSRFIEIYRDYLSPCKSEGGECLKKIVELAQQTKELKKEGEKDYTEREREVISDVKFGYYDLLRELVSSMIKKNDSEAVFYDSLFNIVFCSNLFPKADNEKGVLLYILTRKIRGIPYRKAENLVLMSNDEYRETAKKISDQIMQAMNVLDGRFQTKTEEASQLYEIAKTIKSEKEKVVFLAICLGEVRRQADADEDDD